MVQGEDFYVTGISAMVIIIVPVRSTRLWQAHHSL
jgi:hypothetical protein